MNIEEKYQSSSIPTTVRKADKEDAWRVRQTLASKSNRSSIANARSNTRANTTSPPSLASAASAPYHYRLRRPSAGKSAGVKASEYVSDLPAAPAPMLPVSPLSKATSPEMKWISAAMTTRVTVDDNGCGGTTTSPINQELPVEKVDFPGNAYDATVRGKGVKDGSCVSPLWAPRVRGESEDMVEVEGEAMEIGLRGELEAIAFALREDFEQKLLFTAMEGVKGASEKATKTGRLQLEAHKNESARAIRRLENEGGRLKERIAELETTNAVASTKAEVLSERISALHARSSRCSTMAQCLLAWRAEAKRTRSERSKNATATAHARRKLASRTLKAWKVEARVCINSRGRKAADLKLHAVTKEIIGRYEAELASTRAALDEANNKVAVEKARQREMEEGMRRTLMRGMSAMNMEAMQLMAEARDAGEDSFVMSGMSDSFRYPVGGMASAVSRPLSSRQRISEDCPRPLAPPRPAVPSSR